MNTATKVEMFKAEEGLNISNEAWREYVYPEGKVLRVVAPLRLFVEKGKPGGDRHRLIVKDPAGEAGMYIAPGWLAIRWQTPDYKHGITF